MFIRCFAEKFVDVCRRRRCSRCGSIHVKSERVRRPVGQHDGLDGYSYFCRKCSFRWVKPVLPVI